MDTLPTRLLPLVMEEFPRPLSRACVHRGRLHCARGGIIEEEPETCCSSVEEEDQARRTFLHTLETLRSTSQKNFSTASPSPHST
ncbi:unnamed protein product [Merluccius merluccius]